MFGNYHRMYHTRLHVQRLNVKRENGGKDFVQAEKNIKTVTKGHKKYLDTTTESML